MVDICKECEVTEYVCQFNIIIIVEWREEEKEEKSLPTKRGLLQDGTGRRGMREGNGECEESERVRALTLNRLWMDIEYFR